MPFDIPEASRGRSHTCARGCARQMRARIVCIASSVFAVLVIAAAPAQGQKLPPLPAPQDTGTVPRNVGALRPGDVLKIAVFRDKELTGDYPIDARGYVQIPGLGVIKAAGLDPTEVTDRLRLPPLRGGVRPPQSSSHT